MLVSRARVKPGDKVLIQAGASGVGVYAIQIAKLGAEVAVTASTAQKQERCMALGADLAWTYEETRGEVRAWTSKRGVDIVLDHVGTSAWNTSVRALARGGSLVTCGATTGHEASIDLRILFFKQLNLLGSTMGGMDELREAWATVLRGDIRPVVDRVLPMSRLAEARPAGGPRLSRQSRSGAGSMKQLLMVAALGCAADPARVSPIRLRNHPTPSGVLSLTHSAVNDPDEVWLAVDIPGWRPEDHPLALGDDGTWTIDARLDPGAYAYRFIEFAAWTEGGAEISLCDASAPLAVCADTTWENDWAQDCTTDGGDCDSMVVVNDCSQPRVTVQEVVHADGSITVTGEVSPGVGHDRRHPEWRIHFSPTGRSSVPRGTLGPGRGTSSDRCDCDWREWRRVRAHEHPRLDRRLGLG